GDSERKLAKASGSPADVLVLDLEDSVLPEAKAKAGELVGDYLRAHPRGARTSQLWVRINPLSGEQEMKDLLAVIGGPPYGLMVPNLYRLSDLARYSFSLYACEAREQLPAGSIKLLPVATETAVAPFNLGRYAPEPLPRLLGITWGAEDLSTALGAATNRD